jgi:hypothetical protein
MMGFALTGHRVAIDMSEPLAPAWLVLPLAILALLVIAGHVLALDKAQMPASRKRIRKVNGILMMFTTPLVAYAFAIVSPQRARLFVMVWMIVAGLVTLVLLLALLDVANTWRVTWMERRELRRQMELARAALKALQSKGEGREGAERVLGVVAGKRADSH